MKIEWMPVAARDRRRQFRYIADRNPQAGLNFGRAVERVMKPLEDHPFLGRPGRVEGTRELVVSGTPFVVIYTVAEDRILIIRLLHGAQRWPPEGLPE